VASWIPQSQCSSVTPTLRRRTAYLARLTSQVHNVIRAHLARHPDAEDITLVVLAELAEPIRRFHAKVSPSRLNQDVGLFVAQCLVDLYGADRVQTLRGPDGRTPSPRRNSRDDVDWVTSFTPHRVAPEAGLCADRILLDTVVARKVLHGDPDAIDLDALSRAKGAHPISLADGAFAELTRQIVEGRVPLRDVVRRAERLDAVLDAQLPVAPGGVELAALAGLRPLPGVDLDEMRAYYRETWRYLRTRRSVGDLSKPGFYDLPSGKRFRIGPLDPTHTKPLFEDASERWATWVERAGAQFRGLNRDGHELDDEELRQLVRLFLGTDMDEAALDKIDLAVRVLARRAREAAKERHPHRPQGPNDALDLDLLFGVALPGWVCSQDGRLVRLARETGSADGERVMAPPELLERLTAEQEPTLDADEQRAAWEGWVARGPQGPIDEGAERWP
jgi:hypothetical protein